MPEHDGYHKHSHDKRRETHHRHEHRNRVGREALAALKVLDRYTHPSSVLLVTTLKQADRRGRGRLLAWRHAISPMRAAVGCTLARKRGGALQRALENTRARWLALPRIELATTQTQMREHH